MENLEERIGKIEERNRGVELDKAWETSGARRLLLAIFSYFVVAVFFIVIEIPNPWLNAIVPAVAFLIQQLSMQYFKKLWLRCKK